MIKNQHDRHRSIGSILREPVWKSVDPDRLDRLLSSGSLKLKHIRDLDGFLTMREEVEKQGEAEPDRLQQAIVSFAETTGSITKLLNARKALLLIFDAEELAGELAYAISLCSQKSSVSRSSIPPRDHPGQPLRYSIPESQLPRTWQTALADMRDEFPGADAPSPASEIVKGIARTLRQFTKTALDNGLVVSLSVEVAEAYERSLSSRDPALSRHTIKKYIQDIKDFAAYLGASPEFREYIADRYRRSARRAGQTSTRIDWKVAQIPDFKTVVDLAINMLDKAKVSVDLGSAHALRNRAAAISVVSALPLRVRDLTMFFGTNITWTGEAYHFFIPRTSKPRRPYAVTLDPVLGHFVDHLVLRERPFSHLEAARDECIRQRRALFVNRNGEPAHQYYVSRCWWDIFGTGSHVARAKIHDEFAKLGPRGVRLALAACGHRSEKTGEFYRSQAFGFFASEFVKGELLASISDKQLQDFFT